MMWSWLVVGLAWALPPDGTPGLFDVGNGQIERLAVSDDGSVVVGRDRASTNGFVLFVEDWSTHTIALCDTTGAAVVPMTDGTWDIWTSCGDGTLRLRNFDGKALVPVLDDEGAEIQLSLAASLSGVWYHPASAALYAISVAGDVPTVHVVDAATFATDADVFGGYPLTIQPWTNFSEGVISGDRLIVHHASYNMSAVTLGANPAVLASSSPSLAIDVADIAPSWNGGVYAVDTSGFIAEYLPLTMNFQLMLSNLSAPQAVVASLDPEDPWLVVTGQQIKVWEMTGSGAIVGDNDDYYWASAANLDNPIQDALVHDGYLFGGGEGGNIHVSTARPWVYPKKIVAEPSSATEDDVVTLTFIVDEPGHWEVRRGGDRYGGGVLLAEGDADEAQVDQEISVELTVTGDWDEGDNALYVIHTSDRMLTGHARATVFVDNPPDPPLLGPKSLGFADGALVLEFEGIDDADLDRYEIYVTTTPFEPGDYPTGGPAYDGTTTLKTPISVTKGPGEAVSYRIAPLENDVMHYVAVRAWDQGGLEGDMSRVVSEVPRPSYTAGELAGEEGGAPCSTSPVAAGWLALATGAVGAARRRRRAVATAAIVAVGALAVSEPASAQDRRQRQDWSDLTPARGDFELRYGVIDLDDPAIEEVYDKNPMNLLQMEVGPQLFRFFEVDLGFGFFQELSQKVDTSGIDSAEKTMLTWWPLSLDGTFRLHVVDEQLLVPHARLGVDYIIYSEKSDNGLGGKDTLRGAKTGFHWAVGAGLLLDVFARRRASLLEAQTGINDTYIVVEWREQTVDSRKFPWSSETEPGPGFDFSGRVITAGIKLDY